MAETPDFFCELTAWRKFDVRMGNALLASVASDAVWTRADMGQAF